MKKIRDMKALARETLLDKYGTVIGAYFLSGVITAVSVFITVLCIAAALANTGRFEPLARRLIPSFKAIPALSVVCSVLFTAFVIFTVILVCWLRFGRKKLLLNICRGEKYGCSDIFYAFKAGAHPWRIIGVQLAGAFFVFVNNLIPLIVLLAARVSGFNVNQPDTKSPWYIAIIAVNVLTTLWMAWLSLGFTFADTVILDRPETGVLEALRESLRVTALKKIKLLWMVSFSFIFWYILISISKLAALWVLPYIETTLMIFYLCARGEEFVIPANRPAAPEAEKTPDGQMSKETAPEAPAAAEEPFGAEESAETPEPAAAGNAPQEAAVSAGIPAYYAKKETDEVLIDAETEAEDGTAPKDGIVVSEVSGEETDKAVQETEPAANTAGALPEEVIISEDEV